MNRILCALAFLLSVGAVASADFSPRPVQAVFDKIYAPDGFDSNDLVQVVAEGHFPDSCYRLADAKVEVDLANHDILLRPSALKYGGMCLQVIVPFHRVINIGLMPVGQYKIVQAVHGAPLGEMTIRPAQSREPDDFLYAPISQAVLQNVSGKAFVMISGVFPSSCFSMQEVRVKVEDDLIVVQPIANFAASRDCKSGKFPFENTVAVPEVVSGGRYLLHVRSMNGQAVNSLVDFNPGYLQ